MSFCLKPHSVTSVGVQTSGNEQAEYLDNELFGHFPGELWSTKMSVAGGLLVDWPLEVQFSGGGC